MVTERIDDNKDTHPDDTTEGPIQGILAGILMNIMALVSFTFLQLWLREDSRETPSKLAIGLKLVQQFLTRDQDTNNLFKSDFRIQGENYEALANIDAKNLSNAQHIYPQDNSSKDTYIEQLRRGRQDLTETYKELSPNGWKAHTHHLLAQVLLLFLFLFFGMHLLNSIRCMSKLVILAQLQQHSQVFGDSSVSRLQIINTSIYLTT